LAGSFKLGQKPKAVKPLKKAKVASPAKSPAKKADKKSKVPAKATKTTKAKVA
ncbi:unnamed protein product, partial [Allacma fusca]